MSEAANKGKGPKPPKKDGGGFWSGLAEGLIGGLTSSSSSGPNPTDPAARMAPVHEERHEAAEEAQFRATEGQQGRPPMQRIQRQRDYVARSIDARTAQSGAARIPKSGGAPLGGELRAKMEPKLGADLSAVRVHTSGDSAQAASDFGARAFTVGDDVHFNKGEFAPGSKEGDKLLAHELTHVVQGQKSGIQRKAEADGEQVHKGGGAEVSDPNEPAEKEADAVGEKVGDELHGDEAKDKKDQKPGKDKKSGGDKKDKDHPEKADDKADGKADDKSAVEEKAPAIGAKLDPSRAVVHRAPNAAPAAAPRPNAEVPFQMAGASHTLYFDPSGDDVQVQMASANKLPLTDKFSQAQSALTIFQSYLGTIQDPAAKAAVTTKIAEIQKFNTGSIGDFNALYNKLFPKGGGSPQTNNQQAKAQVQALVSQAQGQLAALQAWATASGVKDLSQDALDTRLQEEGKKAWEETWQKTKDQIVATIAPIKYKGTNKIDFTGSAKAGWKGAHKGITRFDAKDFDVDLFTIHPQDYAAAKNKGAREVAGKIFPTDKFAPPELKTASAQCKSVLSAAFPTIARVADSAVALKQS